MYHVLFTLDTISVTWLSVYVAAKRTDHPFYKF